MVDLGDWNEPLAPLFESEKYIINGYIGKNGKITQEEFEKIGENFA